MARNFDLNSLPLEEITTNSELGLHVMHEPTSQHNENDEVMICSPRSFHQAVNTSNEHRRARHMTYQETRSHGENTGNRSRTQVYGNSSIPIDGQDIAEASQLVTQNMTPIYMCPICLDEMVEDTSTKCGHIFCRSCIMVALDYEKKCPICGLKVRIRDLFRIYLPSFAN